MTEELEPDDNELGELNAFQCYRRMVKLDKTTSRMKNKDWYLDALDLDVQLHCYLHTESSMDCYLYIQSRQHYAEMGSFDPLKWEDAEQQQAFIQDILKHELLRSAKAKSLGVIFYLADEFSLAGLGPEHTDSETLPDLREQMLLDPKEVLEDKTVSLDTHAWRLFPYHGGNANGEFATAIAVSSRFSSLLGAMRDYGNEHNFPIRTCALSAPLCAVASLPWCASANPQGTIAIFNYAKFTLLGFFNSACDLMMLRQVAHAQGASLPRNLGPSVLAASASFELENPEIYIFPMTGVNVEAEVLSLQTAMKQSPLMVVEVSDILSSRGVDVPIPLEVMTTTHELDPEVYPLAGNATFEEFKDDVWPFQDFLTLSQQEYSSYPTAKAMLLLRLSRVLKIVAALIFAGIVAYSGLDISKKIVSDTWHYEKENSQAQLSNLQQKVNEYKRWDMLLIDRSKAWVCMELLSEFVPEDGSIMLTDVQHNLVVASEKAQEGITKTWLISGLTNETRYQQLDEDYNTMDPKTMKAVFRKVAKSTGNAAYSPDVAGRNLHVKFSRQSNSRTRTQNKDTLSLAFTLSITQSYSGQDPIVLKGIQ